MYDVAIVGARCAGSALALLLARHGLKVVVVDRTTFPSDTMSGHFIHAAGVSCLTRMGLLEDLQALGAPAQETMTVDFGPVVLSGQPARAPDGTVAGYAPRRYLFDTMLASAAVAAGAELREGVSFSEPISESGRVTGIRIKTPAGKEKAVSARLVVGADGKRSRFARMVGAEIYHQQPATSCTYYTYWSGLDVTAVRLFVREGLFCVAAPTNDGLTFVAIAWPRDQFTRIRADIPKAYREAVTTIPWIADRMSSARQAERFVGTGDLDGFFRTPAGPGWALLGDAGYHKDPITAQGMTDALLHAELLAEAVVGGLSGASSLDGSLGDYHRARDAMAVRMYGLTNDLARLAPPTPHMAALIVALQENPEQARRFLGIMPGTVAITDFFAPENLRMILPPSLAA